jgi:hypothetical protein
MTLRPKQNERQLALVCGQVFVCAARSGGADAHASLEFATALTTL